MQQLKKYIIQRCYRKIDGEQMYLVNEAARKVMINTHIFDVKDTVWFL